MKHKSLTCCLAILGIAACSASLFADDITWTDGSGTHNWKDGGNWDTGSVPAGAAATAFIKNGGTAVIDTVVPDVNYLRVGGASLSQLSINSGGSLSVLGNGLTRIAYGTSKGAITVNGGKLQTVGGINVGLFAGATATLTIQNEGTVTGTSILLGSASYTGITATLNIGGETTGTTAGWLNGTSVKGTQQTGAVNTVNFNHTGTRYEFTKGAEDPTPVQILNFVTVNAKAGVTVLTGANTYTEGTAIKSGATLLADYATLSTTASSTGTGLVNVEAGGVLGGTGYILGATTVSGTLQPGDYAYDAPTPAYTALKFRNNLAFESTGTTLITLDGTARGTSYSAVDVAGNLTLGGTLKIELGSAFSISADQTESFKIFDLTGAATGGYSSYLLPGTWNGLDLTWDTSGLSSTNFTGIALVAAVPEPSSLLLVLGAGAMVLAAQRGKRRHGSAAA